MEENIAMEGLDSSGRPNRVGMQRVNSRRTGQVQVARTPDLEGSCLVE